MARSYTLKLCSTTAGTSNAAASVTVPRKGSIVAIECVACGTGGAGVDGRVSFELSGQSVSSVTSNDTVDMVFAHINIASNIASSATQSSNCITGIARPVEAGARLYINQVAGGTAFGSAVCVFLVHIAEG